MVTNENERGELILSHDDIDDMDALAIGQTHVAVSEEGSSEVIVLRRDTFEIEFTHNHHSSNVNDVAVAGDEYILSVSDDSVIAVESQEGEKEWTHTEHDASVTTVALSEDTVISGGEDDTLVAVNLGDGSVQWTQSAIVDATPIDLATDEDRAYVALSNDTVASHSVEDGEQEWTHEHHSTELNCIDVGDALVVSGANADIAIASVADSGEHYWEANPANDDRFDVRDIAVDDKYAYAVTNTNYAMLHITDGGVEYEDGAQPATNVATNGSYSYITQSDSLRKLLTGNRTAVRTLDYAVDGTEAELTGKVDWIDEHEDLDLSHVVQLARYRLQGIDEFSEATAGNTSEAPNEFITSVENLMGFSDYEFRASAREETE